MSSNLWRAYETTVFGAVVDGEDIRIRPGQTHPSLDRALAARGLTNWAYITAWNPRTHQLSRHENDERNERLRSDVVGLGCEAFEGQGEPADPGWEPEGSLLVFGLPAREALAMGRHYGQNAIVIGETGAEARLLGCDADI